MSIFSKNGTQLTAAYGVDGSDKDYAYDKSGICVFEKDSDPYAYYSIYAAYNKSRNNAQGMDIYGNYMVVYRDSDYALQFINMTSWAIVYTVATDLTAHGNDITFLKTFYDDNDPFPMIAVGGFVLRIDIANLRAERVLYIHATPTGGTWVTYGTAFNEDMTRYYCLGYNTNDYTDPNGFIFLETWDVSEDLEYPTRISSVTRAWFPCIQGVAYHDGMLWVASGMNNPVKVYALDLTDASIVKTVNLLRTGELEGIGWGYDSTSQKYYCIYGQIYNGITYYRIDFFSQPR